MTTLASILLVLALASPGAEGEPTQENEPAQEEIGTEMQEKAATEEEPEEKVPPSLLGEVSRNDIENAEPSWVAAQVEAEVDSDTALALATAPPEAKLTIYFGTWCDDSKQEMARFWRAIDEAGIFDPEVRYLAVDRGDKRPPELAEELDIHWVPTFIVEKDGREIGRVVESAAETIESDLLSLLQGEAEGVLTGREDGAVPPAEEGDDADEAQVGDAGNR